MLSASERDDLHQEVCRQLSDFHTEEASTDTGEGPMPKKAAVHFDKWENLPLVNARDEVEVYSTQNHVMRDDRDVRWREHHLTYPKLGILACGILAIPASSSSSERNLHTHPHNPHKHTKHTI